MAVWRDLLWMFCSADGLLSPLGVYFSLLACCWGGGHDVALGFRGDKRLLIQPYAFGRPADIVTAGAKFWGCSKGWG